MNLTNYQANILGVFVHATTFRRVLRLIATYIQHTKRGYICVPAVHLLMECQNNPVLQNGVNKATLVVPDGMPLVWILHAKGLQTERLYGPDLMLQTCEAATRHKWTIFLFGGAKGQTKILHRVLVERYPSLRIVGAMDTPTLPVPTSDTRRAIHAINESKANIVFIGLGCPLQELWMIKNRRFLSANMLMGVGAAFDFISGRTRQAPSWMRSIGLEWFYRLVREPKRLWRRYVIQNTRFLFLVLRSLCMRLTIKKN